MIKKKLLDEVVAGGAIRDRNGKIIDREYVKQQQLKKYDEKSEVHIYYAFDDIISDLSNSNGYTSFKYVNNKDEEVELSKEEFLENLVNGELKLSSIKMLQPLPFEGVSKKNNKFIEGHILVCEDGSSFWIKEDGISYANVKLFPLSSPGVVEEVETPFNFSYYTFKDFISTFFLEYRFSNFTIKYYDEATEELVENTYVTTEFLKAPLSIDNDMLKNLRRVSFTDFPETIYENIEQIFKVGRVVLFEKSDIPDLWCMLDIDDKTDEYTPIFYALESVSHAINVVDNLESNSTTNPLSANMGKTLYDGIRYNKQTSAPTKISNFAIANTAYVIEDGVSKQVRGIGYSAKSSEIDLKDCERLVIDRTKLVYLLSVNGPGIILSLVKLGEVIFERKLEDYTSLTVSVPRPRNWNESENTSFIIQIRRNDFTPISERDLESINDCFYIYKNYYRDYKYEIGNVQDLKYGFSVVEGVKHLYDEVGNLEELETENKGSLVEAINELKENSGSGSFLIAKTKEEADAIVADEKNIGQVMLFVGESCNAYIKNSFYLIEVE